MSKLTEISAITVLSANYPALEKKRSVISESVVGYGRPIARIFTSSEKQFFVAKVITPNERNYDNQKFVVSLSSKDMSLMSCLLGGIRQVSKELWFDSKNASKPWYIGKEKNVIPRDWKCNCSQGNPSAPK